MVEIKQHIITHKMVETKQRTITHKIVEITQRIHKMVEKKTAYHNSQRGSQTYFTGGT